MRFLVKLLGKLFVRNKSLLVGVAGSIAIGVPTWRVLSSLYDGQKAIADGDWIEF